MTPFRATLFISGLFGVTKEEVTLVDHGRKRHAQYPDAPFVHYKKPRGRKVLGFAQGYDPYIVIVRGWNVPLDPDDAFLPEKPSNVPGASVREGRYASCDPRWKTDFDAKLDAAVAAGTVEVVADYRAEREATDA